MYQSLQGNLGLAKAIEYFTSIGVTVSIPLNDTQPYDLVADINGILSKISIKTSRSTRNNNSYNVQLRNTGGGRKSNIRQVPFNNTTCDYVFIYTLDENTYLIPAKDIKATNGISVSPDNEWSKYLVYTKKFIDF